MKVKTSELTGPALDWAVAKCEDKNGVLHDDGITRCIVIAAASGFTREAWKPSVNWSQGGPILEREGINTYQMQDSTWQANLDYGMVDEAIYHGPTPLIAAMRCVVASKLGEEVEVPDELC